MYDAVLEIAQKQLQRRALAEPRGITDIRLRRRSEESRGPNEHIEAFVQGVNSHHDHYGREEESSLRRSYLKSRSRVKKSGVRRKERCPPGYG